MEEKLYTMAVEARKNAYSPYSHFKVGAALLCGDGAIYTGCNIENSSFTPTVCAERVAFFCAVADGKRDFIAIAIAGGPEDADELPACYPCGVCRQVMTEFTTPDFKIITADGTRTLADLMPYSFKL